MVYMSTLITFISKPNCYGRSNCAFRFIDHETGRVVEGRSTGGESNIHGILRHWDSPGDWDRSILTQCIELSIRDFKRMVKDWPHAGSRPEELAQFIRDKLAKN